jgi:perosamine synthetase
MMIPYGRQTIDEEDIKAVIEVLRSDWLTTGPKVAEFEAVLARYVGANYAVAVSSGTAALHCAMYALGIGPGHEVIVPTMTFAASANCVVYQGGIPVFVDVAPDTLTIDPEDVERKITPRTKAIIAVDYAGQPGDYAALREIADRHHVALVADACHSLGATYRGRSVGSLADLNVFSFHPVKHITTGEGGMVTTDNETYAKRMRIFRNHGITYDHRRREAQGPWFYEMVDLGYNYRITDFQCALGMSQLQKLPLWLARRQEIARQYDAAFAEIKGITPLTAKVDVRHAYHLYVVRINQDETGMGRGEFYQALRSQGIGVNVHYVPVHLHPFYQERFGTGWGRCPVAESAYEQILSLPMYPAMTDEEIKIVVQAMEMASVKEPLIMIAEAVKSKK